MIATFPQEIQVDSENLTITWKDGFTSHYNLLDLRKKCPCAVCCGGHGGKIGAATGHITSIQLVSWRKVGRYALNFTWVTTTIQEFTLTIISVLTLMEKQSKFTIID